MHLSGLFCKKNLVVSGNTNQARCMEVVMNRNHFLSASDVTSSPYLPLSQPTRVQCSSTIFVSSIFSSYLILPHILRCSLKQSNNRILNNQILSFDIPQGLMLLKRILILFWKIKFSDKFVYFTRLLSMRVLVIVCHKISYCILFVTLH